MAEVLLSALLALAICCGGATALYALARFVGLGKCGDCGRACNPWDAYCWRHSPEVD